MAKNISMEDLAKRFTSPRMKRIFADSKLDREISSARELFTMQKYAIIILLIILALYGIFGSFIPDFDLSRLWIRTDDIIGSVLKYWYVFAWGVGISFLSISSVNVGNFTKAKTILGWNILTGTFAGIWEEIGFRGLFIFLIMIMFMLTNAALKWIILGVVVILALLWFFKLLSKGLWLFGIIIGVLAFLGIWWWCKLPIAEDPLYWIYQHIIFPVMSFISFRLLDPIIYHKEFSPLFIMAAMSANLRFRDGHKYLGLFGYLNAWIIGYILLHAMMYHGLVVAIIIHAVYDVLIGFVHFSKRLVYSQS